MKLRNYLLLAIGAGAALAGREAAAQTNTNSPANSNRSVRIEAFSSLTEDQTSGYSWLNLQAKGVNFGIRDNAVFPEDGRDVNNVDVGLEARILSPLSVKLITNLNADNAEAFDQKLKLGAKLDHKWLRLGLNYGESDTERLVLPYAQLNVKGHTFFVSYSDLEKDNQLISRLNAWTVLNFKKLSIGGGTAGIDNKENYIVSLRAKDIFGYGIQTNAFFNQEGAYKYVFFASRDKFPTEKLSTLLMPIFTGADGMNSIINEQNLLGIDVPVTHECISDANDPGLWFVYEKDKNWFIDAAYMLPRPLTNEKVKPILIARYTRTIVPEQDETTEMRMGGSLIIPVSYRNLKGKIQITGWYNDNNNDHLKPDTNIHLVGGFNF